MRLLKMNFKYVIIVMASAALFSCSKGEDGAIGPIGPQGEQGIQGPEGPAGTNGGANGQDGADGIDGANGADGADGADGQDGNANVIASDWVTIDFVGSGSLVNFDINDSRITQEIIDKGVVLAYGRISSSVVRSIPHTINNKSYFTLLRESDNLFRLLGSSVDGSTEVFNDFGSVRYVIIPGGTSGKSSINFEKITYKEVMDHFELDY